MPKIVDHKQYRRELLLKCFDLFAEHGYAALTMRQIAKGLAVSTGTLYHYFLSKEALFEQLVREMALQDVQRAIAQVRKEKTLLKRLEAVFSFIEKYEDYFNKQTLIWVEFYQHQKRETGGQPQIFKEAWKEHEQEISDLIGIPDRTLLNFLRCVIDGIILHRIFDEEVVFREQTQLLMKMLRAYLPQVEEAI